MTVMGQDALKANLTNPQRTYLWEILIPSPIGDGASETFQVRAQSTQIPSRTNTPIDIPFKQTAGIRVAGKLSYTHEWQCTFVEGEDRKVYDAIRSWQQKIVSEVEGIGVGDPLYKTDLYLLLQSVSAAETMKLKLKGAWVQAVGEAALSYASNEILNYTVTFAFDSVEAMN